MEPEPCTCYTCTPPLSPGYILTWLLLKYILLQLVEHLFTLATREGKSDHVWSQLTQLSQAPGYHSIPGTILTQTLWLNKKGNKSLCLWEAFLQTPCRLPEVPKGSSGLDASSLRTKKHTADWVWLGKGLWIYSKPFLQPLGLLLKAVCHATLTLCRFCHFWGGG
jgi:hypothetical protein